MGLVDSPDDRVLADRGLSEGTGDLGPVISGLFPNLVPEINSDDLLVTGRDSDEFLGHAGVSGLPASSGEVSA